MRSVRGSPAAWVLAIAALTLTAGCLGLMEDEQAAGSQSVGSQTDDLDPTEATQAMWEMEHKDPYLDVEPTGDVEKYQFWVEGIAINPHGDLALFAETGGR